ncbi:hypothetical protein CH63R_10396 [Colletotrichum higginsianum IMI 349063]|uniref:Uncharacterized protein n=1 Tax=Colletotrichum higginsianum (strain IMI 349063) TaxID=759273 RepID=A0A1B7Y2Q2_COLHI|nr:uncharacterized protein CH63R_10396 [Colletotrichum higginsianum IMI 349063]OBR06276.1 hypothetical protein CH63R_10396 [Colletotrichum higginsianum IMI 349063]
MPLTGVDHTLTEYGAENMTTASFMIFMIVYPATRRECGWRRKMGKKETKYFITSRRAVAHGRRLLRLPKENSEGFLTTPFPLLDLDAPEARQAHTEWKEGGEGGQCWQAAFFPATFPATFPITRYLGSREVVTPRTANWQGRVQKPNTTVTAETLSPVTTYMVMDVVKATACTALLTAHHGSLAGRGPHVASGSLSPVRHGIVLHPSVPSRISSPSSLPQHLWHFTKYK